MLSFIDRQASRRDAPQSEPLEFIVTCVDPDSTGSKHGFRIVQPEIPGRFAPILSPRSLTSEADRTCRLARLAVRIWPDRDAQWVGDVTSHNVESFSVDARVLAATLSVQLVAIRQAGTASDRLLLGRGVNRFVTARPGAPDTFNRRLQTASALSISRRYGPMIKILESPLPLLLIVGTVGDASTSTHLSSLAQRIARDALAYGRLDCDIIRDRDFADGDARGRNVVLLGGAFENEVLAKWSKRWTLEGRPPYMPLSFFY